MVHGVGIASGIEARWGAMIRAFLTCKQKPSADIPGAARRPRSSNSISNVENISNVKNNCNFRHFNNDNNFRVGLKSVQGKLELLDSLNSKNSNLSSSKRSCTCTSSCIYDMVNGSNSDDYGVIP